jgi:hypothetical protein
MRALGGGLTVNQSDGAKQVGAQEGAEIIAVDVARDIDSVTPFYRGATPERWFA